MKLLKIAGKANDQLYRHPESDIIYICLSKKGKGRIQRSTKTTNLTEARRIADEIKFEFLGQRNPKLGRKLIKELFPEWLETKKIKAKATYAQYELSYRHLMPYLESMAPEDVTNVWWESEYIPSMLKAKSGKFKFFNDRKTLRGFLISCRDNGLIDRLPKLINPDGETDVGKVFTDQEVKRLFEHAGLPLLTQLTMALDEYMRSSEILFLAKSEVDRKNRIIHLDTARVKIRRRRSFAYGEALEQCFEALEAAGLTSETHWFPSPTQVGKSIGKAGNRKAWTTCRRKANVVGRFHDLRHTALTRDLKKTGSNQILICFKAGVSLALAQKRYLHLTADDTRVIAKSIEGSASVGGKVGE